MASSKYSRRVFLKSLGIVLLTSGCAAGPFDLVSEPTATPLPTPTPIPLAPANPVAQDYLDAWGGGDYPKMYSLLSLPSQQRITEAAFLQRYTHVLNVLTATGVTSQLRSLLHNNNQAAATFLSQFETRRFGLIEADNQMALEYYSGQWGVVWQPTLILPQLGDGISLAFLSEQPTRGNIYDRNYHAMATQGELVTVGVIPQYIESYEQTVALVQRLTGVSRQIIDDRISAARPDWFVPIADITFEISLENEAVLADTPGIERRTNTTRVYPDGPTGAHIIGYMGSIPADLQGQYLAQGYSGDEMVGLSGVEAWSETELAGQRGGRLVTVGPSPSQQVLSELGSAPSAAGSSVYLTLDSRFQATTEYLLGERKGAIVVMDPNNGKIFALATYPRFNPMELTSSTDATVWSRLSSHPDFPLLSRATQGTYPPGSIFKIVSITAALESLGLDPATTFTCTGKWAGLGPQFVKECWLKRGHGPISLIDGLTQSCNVVFYEVGLALQRANPDYLPEWARMFGLGAPTNIAGIGQESPGVVPDEAWKQATFGQPMFDGDAVNGAIGQGYTLVTPIQIARMVAVIANGGHLVRPTVIDRVVALDNTETLQSAEIVSTLPIKSENLQLIRESLNAITSGVGGTARLAFEGAEYSVAGKTGTAESGRGEPHAWFAGYAPADKPRVTISVLLEEAGEGSKVAAPLFRQVLEAFFEWEASLT
jgi:penicillin-binding protein 2